MKWTSALAIVTVMGAVGCSDVPKEPEAPKVTKEEPKEPARYKEPANTAYLEARKGILADLAAKNAADHWVLPENSGYATVNGDEKNPGYYEVIVKGHRSDRDIERTFEVILHQEKITQAWIVDKTSVDGGRFLGQ